MRLRNKKWIKDFLIENSQFLINKEITKKYSIKELFGNNNPTFLEIGCGKGEFISNFALHNKQNNFIALEKEPVICGMAIKKALNTFDNVPIDNLKFCNDFAENLPNILEKNSLEKIFLNFSDPWPKTKSIKKRLTSPLFLDIYIQLLKNNGEVEFKTDNINLFIFTLNEVKKHPQLKIVNSTENLYEDKAMFDGNLTTEYETKFRNLGVSIKKIIFKKQM